MNENLPNKGFRLYAVLSGGWEDFNIVAICTSLSQARKMRDEFNKKQPEFFRSCSYIRVFYDGVIQEYYPSPIRDLDTVENDVV